MARKKKEEVKEIKKGIKAIFKEAKIMARKKNEEVKEIKKGIKAKQKDIEIMSLDNKPITKEVSKEPIQVHDKFASVPPKKVDTKKTINIKNGRVYKDLGNGYGMYSDTGEAFRI